MISKIISFCFVYILSVMNFLVILSPVTFILFAKYFVYKSDNNYILMYLLLLIIGVVSLLMLIFFVFNFVFNLSVRKYKKQYKSYQKYNDLLFLKDIFEDLKENFHCNNVELLINQSNEISACAVGGLKEHAIILNYGLLKHYKNKSTDKNDFLMHIKAIIAHEMSHLINKDYFCGLFLIINEKSLLFISKFIFFFFNIIIKLIAYIPFIGYGLAFLIKKTYDLLDYVITFFYYKIVMKLYRFLQMQISKQIEFRSDEQAALVVGGDNMSKTLSLLGPTSWFNIFSTHPKTQNRTKRVDIIYKKDNCEIKPVFGVNLLFYFSIILIFCIAFASFKNIDFKRINNDFNSAYQKYKNSVSDKKNRFIMFMQDINK